MKGDQKMEKLYSIMRDFLEVEYNQKSVLSVLETLEAAYSGDQEEKTKLIINHTKGCLKALQRELRVAINKMDNYIAETAGGK